MYEGLFDDRTPGAQLDAVPPVEMPGGMPETPPDMPPDMLPATPKGFPPDWPPEVVPVAFWPEDVLRRALQDAPGARLARVVAEAVDVDGNLEIGMPVAADPDQDSGDGAGAGGGAGVGFSVLADLSDEALADMVVACGRLQSWVAGVQARVVAERAARESHPLAHNSLVGQVTGELVVTAPEATEVVVRAESGTRHPTVITALLKGRIDTRKAHTLLRSASRLTVVERAEAISRFLPQAPARTWKWLQARMLAFAKNLHGASATAQAEAQRRSVQVDRAENDMGWLSAYLPAVDAAAVWGVVDDMAHQLRHVTGEERTLSQLRADSLTGIVTGRLLPADRYTEADADSDKTTGATTGTATAGSVGPDIGARAEMTTAGNAATTGSTQSPIGEPEPVCTCGGRVPVQQIVRKIVVQEVVRPVRIIPTRPVVRVTIPATALLGLDNAPGELAGFGPVPAEIARMIATDATWHRLLTDPVTGILLDYSTTAYQPGKTLRGAIEARDAMCTFPCCDTPAERCDLDHIQPFDHDHKNTSSIEGSKANGWGQANAHNLHALCRKHHLLKTHAGWNIVRDPQTGITTWTAPTGRTHTRPPTVLDTHIDLGEIDPDTSQDLSLRAMTGQRLPRVYATTEPGSVPIHPDRPIHPDHGTDRTHPTDQAAPSEPTSPTDSTSPTDPTSPTARAHPDEPPF
ncbi:HNH endonuclease [Promicromonospora sp. NPDC023805]|uniref:HNH endonuclease signature motif containing protein n=1 Tax=Promicromonospora sp. NPDC023805 TaxID=3154696 RepID=UPI00340FA033